MILNNLFLSPFCLYLWEDFYVPCSMSLNDSLHELYRTSKGVTYQCDLTNRIVLNFADQVMAFRMADFVLFRRKAERVNLHEMIFNLDDEYDYEVLEAPKSNQKLVLTLCDLVQLRDLLAGTQFTLNLNSMLHEVLYTYSY